jgi:argininosuccinate lyase
VSGTGRLIGELGSRTRQVIYGELGKAEIETELPFMLDVDKAHLVMLTEQRLISPEAAKALVCCLDELAAKQFLPLLSRPAPRGLYLMYEGYLTELLGAEIGGVLHSGRSRNDLKATITSLRLRVWLLGFAEQAVRLEAVLLSRARAHQAVVMPVYTHFQAAMPITYGYYLLGIALAVGREIEALRSAAASLSVSPLGANAVAGTDLPIDSAHTAALLGFSASTQHALDAVASRDVALRLLSAATGLAIVLSRLAVDLQLWSTAEFNFISFPDRLVGGSSAMPQKRNAFLLEHIKAKPGEALGAWAGAASAMANTPFTNSIEVGTEAMTVIWRGLHAVEQAVLLSQVTVSGARPVPARMSERAVNGFTAATSVANQLVRRGVPFRTAHHLVGEAVRRAIETDSAQLTDFEPPKWLDELELADLEPSTLVRAQVHGGGPGAFAEAYRQACAAWDVHRRWHRQWRRSVAIAATGLAKAVEAIRHPVGLEKLDVGS